MNINVTLGMKTHLLGKMEAVKTIPDIKKKIIPILKRHAVKKASIFGSFARGEVKARSDVDLLIEYKTNNKSLFDLVNLRDELEGILGRKVDIVTYNSIYWRLRDQILSEQVMIL
jgi:hypothetical protein